MCPQDTTEQNLGVVQCSSLRKGGIQTTRSGQVKVIRASNLRLANVKERLRRLGLFNLKAKNTWRLGIGISSLRRGQVTPGCAGLSSLSCKANRQLPDDLFSPIIDSSSFFFFPKPFHSTLSSKHTAPTNTNSTQNIVVIDWGKQNRRQNEWRKK